MPTCLVTGSNRGIGLEFVKQYAADGWRVIATCRNPDGAADLRALKGNIQILEMDVTNFAQVEGVAARLNTVAIDLLINNAGVYGPRTVSVDTVDYGVWGEVLRTDTMAPLKVSAAFLEHVARSEQKRIVAITSKMGSIADNGSGGAYIYRSAKAALNAVMRSLAIDVRDRRVIVIVVHPGWARTEMGGTGAPLEVFESVASIRDVIAKLQFRDSGRFINYDGSEVPW